jgi:hypothetical protein
MKTFGPTDNTAPAQRDSAKSLTWGIFPQGAPSLLKDLPIVLAAFSVFYAFLAVTRSWLTPVSSQTEIDLRPGALPAYAMFSVMRIAISYVMRKLEIRNISELVRHAVRNKIIEP